MANQVRDSSFYGLDMQKYDAIARSEMGELADVLIARREERTKDWNQNDWHTLFDKRHSFLLNINRCRDEGFLPQDTKTQDCIHQWFDGIIVPFYSPDKKEYLALIKLNCTHPEFRTGFEKYHSSLPRYLLEAAQCFAENHLH